MSKKNEGKAKLGLLLALVVAFVAASVHAYTVKRSVDADGTQIFLLEDSGNLTVAGTVTSAGAQTISSGGLTLTAGDLTVTAGDINSTLGDLTLTAGDITSTLGDFTMTAGNALLSSGNLTLTSGNAILTSGDLTVSSGNTLLTSGNLTMTSGDFTITAGKVNLGTYTETIANLGVITNQGAVAILTGVSTGTTNTFLNPTAAGEFFTIINNSAWAIDIADAGNVKLSAAAALFQDDTLSLVSISSSVWVEVSRSTNTP
mgnify:CR=1 FL=1